MRAAFIIPAVAGLFLVSCQTETARIPFKAGTVGAERQKDFDTCKIASFKEIPQTIATQINPGYSSAPSISCNNIGHSVFCNTYGGINIPPSSYNYDVNQGLRYRFIDACLQRKGYTFLERPVCKPGEKPAVAVPAIKPEDVKCSVGSLDE